MDTILKYSLLLFTWINVSAQINVSGKVTDPEGMAIPYINVVATTLPDSIFAAGTSTDDKGLYSLRLKTDFKGLLTVSGLSYKTVSKTVNRTETEYNFILKEELNQLDGVVLNYREQLFEKRPDRIVVNVQNTITAAGGTALEILEKSPGVGIDRQNGSIALNGKQGVQVMINGKLARIPTNAVIQMLNGMTAQNIESIELITNPPAKYEASGSALININLIENEFIGTNGSYGGNLNYYEDIGYGLNFNLNNRSGKFNSFIDYNSSLTQNKNEWFTETILSSDSGQLINNSLIDRYSSQFNHNLRMGTTYSVNDRIDINLLASGYTNRWKTDDFSDGVIEASQDSTLIFSGETKEKNHWLRGLLSLGMDYKVNERSDISGYIDYLMYDNDQPASFDFNYINSQSQNSFEETIKTSKKTPISFWVGKLDYSNRVSDKLKLESGVKTSLSDFENEFDVNITSDFSSRNLETLSALSKLDENIYAFYLSSEYVLDEDLTITGGIRYEHTTTQLGSLGQELIVDRNYGNFFPSVSINRSLGEKSNISFAYGKRIVRPTFNDLAPFAFFQSPQTLVSGNSNLLPAITDNFEINYQPGKWWISLSYSYTKDFIAGFQPEVDEETGIQLVRPENLNYFKSYGGQISLPLKASDWFDFQNTISLYNIEIDPKGTGDNDIFSNLNFGYQGSATFFLPSNFSLELNANYQSNPSFLGVTDLEPQFKMDIGVKKKLGENGGSLSLVFTDVFNTYRWEWSRAEGAITEFDFNGYYYWDQHGIRLNYTRNFGNRKLEAVDMESGSEQEQRRVN